MSRDLFIPRAPLFNAFEDLFDFDRHFYFFNRDEKDMHPYDVVRKSNSIVITHNVLGLEKEDLKVSVKTENLKHYLVISGTSKDKVTGKTGTCQVVVPITRPATPEYFSSLVSPILYEYFHFLYFFEYFLLVFYLKKGLSFQHFPHTIP